MGDSKKKTSEVFRIMNSDKQSGISNFIYCRVESVMPLVNHFDHALHWPRFFRHIMKKYDVIQKAENRDIIIALSSKRTKAQINIFNEFWTCGFFGICERRKIDIRADKQKHLPHPVHGHSEA